MKGRKFEMAVILLTVALVAVTAGYMIARVPVAETFDISVARAPVTPPRPQATPTPDGRAADTPADTSSADMPPLEPPPSVQPDEIAREQTENSRAEQTEQSERTGETGESPSPAPDLPPPEQPSPAEPDPSGPVNLNTAGLEDLQRLPGIGPALAQRIVDDRDAHGPYETVDELRRVSGIGVKTVEKLYGQAVVE